MCRPKNVFFVSHPLFHHLVTCCVPSSITDSEAALNCVVSNPGNSNWQPHTSIFTGRQQLSPLARYMEVSLPDVCKSRCWRLGGIRIAYRSSAAATQLAPRLYIHQTLGRTEAGCRESRTIKDLRAEHLCQNLRRNCTLATAVDPREKTAMPRESGQKNVPGPQ